MLKFSGMIYKIGINPVVDPPDDVLSSIFKQARRSKGPIPVCGRVNGADYIQTLVKYAGAWRLYINGEMLGASGLKVGDIADIEIEFDSRPRLMPMPVQLEKALENDLAAKDAFEKLPLSRQKEILRYLSSLKTAAVIDKNIERITRQLSGDETIANSTKPTV